MGRDRRSWPPLPDGEESELKHLADRMNVRVTYDAAAWRRGHAHVELRERGRDGTMLGKFPSPAIALGFLKGRAS